MNINKQSVEWQLIKAKLNTIIIAARDAMESTALPMEEYNFLRGQIAVARELIEWVEPTTPPITTEDDYGISDPE
jgi:hypothetical protein